MNHRDVKRTLDDGDHTEMNKRKRNQNYNDNRASTNRYAGVMSKVEVQVSRRKSVRMEEIDTYEEGMGVRSEGRNYVCLTSLC